MSDQLSTSQHFFLQGYAYDGSVLYISMISTSAVHAICVDVYLTYLYGNKSPLEITSSAPVQRNIKPNEKAAQIFCRAPADTVFLAPLYFCRHSEHVANPRSSLLGKSRIYGFVPAVVELIILCVCFFVSALLTCRSISA